MANGFTSYGFGDTATWGQYAGPANDPRTPECFSDECGDETMTEALQSMAGLYVQCQSTGKAFFRVMQKPSSQTHEAMMLSKKVLA